MLFWKMQGAGNDFILFNNLDGRYVDYSQLAKKLCDRHFGIGADGMMACEKSTSCDIKMVYYNQDGSKADMCGNGIRCFSKFIYENKIVDKTSFLVEAAARNYDISLITQNDEVKLVKVEMGLPTLEPKLIPALTDYTEFINEEIVIEDRKFLASAVLIGVPHLVIFEDDISLKELDYYGSRLEQNTKLFPKKINVNFVKIIDKSTIGVKTYERGCGYTLACGTGMTSSAYIANKLGLVNDKVKVSSPGGEVEIEILKEKLYMTGPAQKICDGRVDDDWLLA